MESGNCNYDTFHMHTLAAVRLSAPRRIAIAFSPRGEKFPKRPDPPLSDTGQDLSSARVGRRTQMTN